MMPSFEKTVELLSGEDGVSIIVRPIFPFVAEGYRIKSGSVLEIFGDGKRIAIDIPEDVQEDFRGAEQADLCEFPMEGREPVRELILLRSD